MIFLFEIVEINSLLRDIVYESIRNYEIIIFAQVIRWLS